MNTRSKDKPDIRAFVQHGFLEQGTAGTQASGRCPFCGKDKHFYVNPTTRKWDCKRCGKQGGFQTFLDEMNKLCQESMTPDMLRELSQNRGLALSTFEHFEIGYNPNTGAYTIPIWSADRERLWDIRIYQDSKLLNTASCQAGLFNWWDDFESASKVYICEGEWDGMALWEVITRRKKDEGAVLAVPGAGTFKADWAPLLRNKEVVVCFDNDKAGRLGAEKANTLLSPLAKSLKFINWPDKTPEGFDLRDMYVKEEKRNPVKFWERLTSYLNAAPADPVETPASGEIEAPGASKPAKKSYAPKLEGSGVAPEKVYESYRKWLHLPDVVVLDFMFGLTIANRLPGDPLWGQLVGPSGATKTELLVSLDEAPFITTATSITPHALISGANFAGGGDPSLIPRWDGKVVIIKDLTVLLTLNQTHRDEIFSILRDAYDGKTEKSFGNGVVRSYKICFGMLAGVTPVIEIFSEEHTSLGERWLRFPVSVPETLKGKLDFTRRAVKNVGQEDVMRQDLRDVAKAVLSRKFDWEIIVPDEIEEKVLHAAQLTALLRSTIKRDNYTREITHRPFSEMATRLAKQFQKQLLGTTYFLGEEKANEKAFEVVRRIAVGTIPSKLNDIIGKCYKKDAQAYYSLDELMRMSRLPQNTVQRTVDGLLALDVMVRKPGMNGLRAEYKLTRDILSLIEKSEIFK